ncbi:hypothetical protein [Nocardioides plantarum]|uniref:DUF3558 domain-containing protein n=1 Tax=Nocardioides plantarum TaxID=29299 RepID=A0ABV5KFT3_9ACTN|nr:hypothetical protein [Nocardioides plantarum]
MNRDETWLADNLRAAAPSPPPASDLLKGIAAERRASRRRRSAAGVVAVVAAIVAIAVVVPSLQRSLDGDTDGLPPSTTDTKRPAPGDATGCQLQADPNNSTPVGQWPWNVPNHPVEARLCAIDDGETILQAPADPLRVGIEDLVSTLKPPRVPPTRGNETVCAGTGGLPFAIEFGYADGSTHTIYANTATGSDGCGPSGRPAYEAFERLLRAQRNSMTPPYPDATSTCPLPVTYSADSMLGRFDDAVSLTVCVTDRDARTWSQEVEVPAADLEILKADARSDTQTPSSFGQCADDRTSILLRGVTAWGDTVSQWSLSCRSFYNAWSPSAQGMALLDRLIGANTAR